MQMVHCDFSAPLSNRSDVVSCESNIGFLYQFEILPSTSELVLLQVETRGKPENSHEIITKNLQNSKLMKHRDKRHSNYATRTRLIFILP
jgi:hypothetical protein